MFLFFKFQDIGLPSLTYIQRGGVRIEKNPNLCFSDTIDFTAIAAHTTKKDHFISANRPANECPKCPSGKIIDDTSLNGSKHKTEELKCPSTMIDNKQMSLCWNQKMCQKGKSLVFLFFFFIIIYNFLFGFSLSISLWKSNM